MDSFKRFGEEKLPDRECFYSSVKDRTTGDNGEKLDGHISDKDYFTCNKSWCFWKVYWHILKTLQTRSLSLF